MVTYQAGSSHHEAIIMPDRSLDGSNRQFSLNLLSGGDIMMVTYQAGSSHHEAIIVPDRSLDGGNTQFSLKFLSHLIHDIVCDVVVKAERILDVHGTKLEEITVNYKHLQKEGRYNF